MHLRPANVKEAMGVRDGLLRVNPTADVMAEVKRSHFWEIKKREALTVPQQRSLTRFLENTREFHGWVPVLMVLLGTGMRIGDDFVIIRLNPLETAKYKGFQEIWSYDFLQRSKHKTSERRIKLNKVS